jgi:hypothetical protein
LNLRKFHKIFGKIAPEFIWRLESGINLRGTKNDKEYCPVTAVCEAETGNYYEPHQLDRAALFVGLNSENYNAIGHAADGYYLSKYQNTRDALLRRVKLEYQLDGRKVPSEG